MTKHDNLIQELPCRATTAVRARIGEYEKNFTDGSFPRN